MTIPKSFSTTSLASLPPEDEKVQGEPRDFMNEEWQEASRQRLSGKLSSSTDFGTGRGARAELNGLTNVQVLNGKEDKYDGIIVNPSTLPSCVDEFYYSLIASLKHWKSRGKKGIWLEIPKQSASFIPIAIEEGFEIHHAEKGYVMLTHWLADSASTLPPNASHQVGIGAFILNPEGKILAVQEKNGPLKGLNVWKLPTGLVEQSEDICDAAIREVREETGIDSEFLQIIAFRQAHQIAFGKSDLFFICALKPITFKVTPQQSEIHDAKWLDWDEFIDQPFFQEREIFKTLLNLCLENSRDNYVGFQAQKFATSNSHTYLYHSQKF